MNTTWEQIKTPQFLVGTIIAGILINIVSHWLISRFPQNFKNFVSNLSTKWRTRTKEMRQARENRIAPLIGNLQEQQLLISLATTKRLSGFINILPLFFVALLTLVGVLSLLNSIENHKTAWEVVKFSVEVLFGAAMTLVIFQVVVTEFEEAGSMVQDV